MNAVISHNSCTFHTCAQLMKKSFFACDATVDLEAQSVPQVVRPEESLRVRDVSEDPANFASQAVWSTTRLSESKHICCGVAIGLELSTNVVAAERETNFQCRCKS